MNTESQGQSQPQRTLIAFATHWGSKFGGINSFNADLVAALGLAFYRSMRVICVVLDADEADVTKVLQTHQVTVLSLGRKNDSAFSPDFLGEVEALLSQCGCTLGADTVCLGHDRITGAIALATAQKIGGRSALIHHMSYADYETFAEGAEKAREKEGEQEALFVKGDVLFAVGPVLRNALQDMVEHAVTMLIPGLHEIDAAAAPNTFTGFLSGRINEKTHRIKQAHLGVAGFARATARANTELHLPESLKSSRNPCLKVRGLDESNAAAGTDPETDLKRFAESYAGGVINLRALPFTIHREEAFKELRKASVALMPSWHEGFGLVAWEAIAAGVPLILSKKSGVYHLLGELDGGVYQSLVIPIDVRGQVDEPYFHPDDLKNVADAIIQVAHDPQKARGKASQLREMLLQKGCTWKSCADTLVKALGWESAAIPDHLPAFPPLPVEAPVSESVAPPAADDLLDLPVPQWQPGKGLANSQLLRAEEAVIPFDAAALPFLDEQLAWAKDAAFPLAARLLIGPGGSGKTRLALQLCSQLRSEGWWAGFLRRPAQFAEIHARLKAGAEPALIVIDYAETRIEDLFALIRPLILSPGSQPVRILLLARSGGDWWDRLDGRDPQCESFFAGYATSGPYPIPELHATPASREAAFQRAMHLFSAKLGLPVPSHSPDLTAEHYAHPLLVQMAALLALHDEQPSTAEGLTRSLVNHEKRYWGHLLKDNPEAAEQAAQLMALSTLCDGLQTPREIEPIWKEADCGTGAQLKAAFNQLKILYPHKGGLQSLRPDLLGEALVTQVLLSNQGPDILNAVLGKAEERIRHHVWTVLARTLRHRADLMPVVQEALAAHYLKNANSAVEVCCQIPGSLPKVMELAYERLPGNLKLQVAQQLAFTFKEDQLPLNDLSLSISKARLNQARRKINKGSQKNAESEQVELASSLTQASVDYLRCGNLEAATPLALEAEKIYRNLAKANPARFDRSWALALNNYGGCLSDNGRYEESLKIAKQAVEIFKRLAQKERKFESYLAGAQMNYANGLGAIGRYDEALVEAGSSVEIYEHLASLDAETFEPDWAMALINYSRWLGGKGQDEEALEAAKQALDIYKRLAKIKPERFEHFWASSLTSYAGRLSESGYKEEVLDTANHALEIYERLAKIKPERFEGDWAMALRNYSCMSENGWIGDALARAKQSLDIYEGLAQKNSERYECEWAMALSNYAMRLSEKGYYTEALGLAKRASEVYRRLAEEKPGRFEDDWAASLIVYANRLGENGLHKDALTIANRALQIYERLAREKPERHEGDWAMSLNNYAVSLINDGQHEEALKISKKSLDVYRQLAQRKPERFEGDWAMALNNYSNRQSTSGEFQEALKTAENSMQIYERLSRGRSKQFESEWALALHNYANRLSENGQHQKALSAIRQANEIYQRWALKLPGRHGVSHRTGVLDECFLAWLCDLEACRGSLPVPIDPNILEHSKREWLAVVFFENYVRACLASDLSEQLHSAKGALAQWERLEAGQRLLGEEMFFLVAAMLEAAAATHPDLHPPPDWHASYEAMVKRRRGNIPAWLLDAAKKLGLQLPAVSLTPHAIEASTQAAIQAVDVPDASVLPEHL